MQWTLSFKTFIIKETDKMMPVYDLIIIGGGPTGINCAIEAQKAKLKYLVLEKGVLVNSIYHFPINMTFFSTSKLLEIGNTPFISHNEKPTRREALEYYRRLQQNFLLNIHTYEPVLDMQQVDDTYVLTSTKASYSTRAVVIATGFYDTPRLLEVPGENLPKVKHYYDDAHPYIGTNVLVIGAANSACQVALDLWRKGAKVSMAIREDKVYKGVKYWIKPDIENRIKEGSIPTYFKTTVKEIRSQEVVLQGPEGEFVLENDFVLAMTGYTPNYKFIRQLGVNVPENGDRIPLHNDETLETNLPNVYLAGVICAGMRTGKLFIENTRDHAEIILRDIVSKKPATIK